MVHMYYNVPDVEHMGDVNNEEYKLQTLGACDFDEDIMWNDDEIEECIISFFCDESEVYKFEQYGAFQYS